MLAPLLLLALVACSGSRAVELGCDPDVLVKSSPGEDRASPGFDYPKDALSILSWSRGLPLTERSGNDEVVFVYMEDRVRVGAAFVVRGSEGWFVDELWACPQA